jgi:hypothetical protein
VETVRLDILTVWDQIRFTFRNRQKGDRVEIAQLEAHAFIKRFLLHILPSGFMQFLWLCRVAHRRSRW